MQFVKGVPYFCQGVNKIKQFPYLTKNIACDILVIGGGICGANGIINTMFGIDVLLDSLENKSNKFTKIFSPLREK